MTPTNRNSRRRLFVEHPRKAGTLLLTIGAFLVYFGIVKPVIDAQNGIGSISVSNTAGTAGVVGSLLGLLYLLGGSRCARIFHPLPGESRVPLYIFCVIVGIMDISIHILVRGYLKGLGYHF